MIKVAAGRVHLILISFVILNPYISNIIEWYLHGGLWLKNSLLNQAEESEEESAIGK